MLYCPWRNEEKDLLNNCQTYQERYNQVETIVCKNKQQYEHHADILEQAIQDMNDDVSDSAMTHPVAPVAQHNNEQDIATKSKPSELFGCFDPGTCKQHKEYDLFDDMGILPRTNDEEQLVQKHLNDNDCRKLVRSLNIEQKELFYHVLHAIKTDNDPLRLFLSGGVGVGKSTVTNALYEALSRNLSSVPGENPDEVKVLKVAPTGKAAFNIKGNTLHSAFKIPANRGYKYCALDADRLNTIRAQLRKLKAIFIDEISMVGSGMFNFLNLRLQQIMGTKEVFGGVNVITVGDLFQLKPVFDKWIFETSNDSYGALATNIWREYFSLYELTQIMRQKDDVPFAELLNRLREGNHTNYDIETLKQRVLATTPGDHDYSLNTPHLFSTNQLVNSHNNTVFQQAITEKAFIKCVDVIVGDVADEVKEKMKEKIPDDPTKTMGLNKIVAVAVGTKYDLTTNVKVTDGLTNGAECIVEKTDYISSRPSIIWVSFPDAHIGLNHRKEYAYLYNNTTDKSWTPILEITRQFKISKRHQAQVLRRQFPLRAAAAKTIYRSQGDTLEAIVDLPSTSRLRNSSSLNILNLNETKICVSKKIQEEMARLRSELLISCIPRLIDIKASTKILFHNVRSLHLHIDDVAGEYNVQAADINIFVETALCSSDNDDDYHIDDFRLFRNDVSADSNRRTCYGTAVYIKTDMPCAVEPCRANYNDVETTVSVLYTPMSDLCVVGIYRSKSKVNMKAFIESLNDLLDNIIPRGPTVILGDFNVNLLETSSEKNALTKNHLEQRGYTQLITKYTTDYKSLLDHVYTNIPDRIQSSGVLESYFSDHKPVYVCID